DRAATLLEEAVALDTGFAMAYRKLAVIGFNTFAAPSRMAAVSTKAFRHRDRLAPLERHLAVANYYTFAEFDRAKAAAAYRAALHLVRGRLAEAEAAGRAYMETSERRGLPGAYLDGAVGLALLNVRYRHATGTGRRTVEAALARRPLTSIAAPDRPYLSLALFYAEAGDVPRAKALLADYAAAVPDAQQWRDAFRRGAAATLAMAE